ncbi:MAG: response regulator transcription factor [Psychrobacillus sp.]
MLKEKILIVDDEVDIVSFMKDSLEDEGYEVLTAHNGYDAIQLAKQNPSLVLLDVMMDDIDGYEVCEKIRSNLPGPIIFLSACQEESNRIQGLLVGGDDYLIKPFSLTELKARIYAHLRREKRKKEYLPYEVKRYGEVTIDYKGRLVYINEEMVELTNKQFEIVWLLAENKGQVFSKSHIYERVWGLEADGEDSTVTEHIKKIRAKFQVIKPDNTFIQTVWGVGYRWG